MGRVSHDSLPFKLYIILFLNTLFCIHFIPFPAYQIINMSAADYYGPNPHNDHTPGPINYGPLDNYAPSGSNGNPPLRGYSPSNNYDPNDPEGERGLGSTIIGGAAGGYAGHKLGNGKLATAGGAVLGAVGANMASHAWKEQ